MLEEKRNGLLTAATSAVVSGYRYIHGHDRKDAGVSEGTSGCLLVPPGSLPEPLVGSTRPQKRLHENPAIMTAQLQHFALSDLHARELGFEPGRRDGDLRSVALRPSHIRMIRSAAIQTPNIRIPNQKPETRN
jgi:hypothetical protein